MNLRHPISYLLLSVLLLFAGSLCPGQYLMPGNRQQASQANRNVDMVSFKREMTHVYADMRVIQEDMRILVSRIVTLEQENTAKDALIRELQERLASYERRFQQLDQELRSSEERLVTAIGRVQDGTLKAANSSAQQGLDSLKGMVLRELSRIEGIAVQAANTASRSVPQAVPVGEWKEIRVQAGDTLIGIASQAGISVRSLRQCNGLKNDVIRVGQVLKVPVAQ